MTGNVRKLALDLGFFWLLPIQLLMALMLDYDYLRRPDLSGAFAAGVILSLQATVTQNKIGLWRTLPVTDRQIGRARWWQMTGLPGIGIAAMLGLAFAVHALVIAVGWDFPAEQTDAAAVARSLLLQFSYPVFLTLISLALNFARVRRSPWAWMGVIATGLPWLLLLPHAVPGLTAHTRILALGTVGLIAAIILYRTAPYWPLPVTHPMQLDIGGHDSQAATSDRAGQGGWLALCGMAVTRPLLTVGALLAAYVGLIVALRLDRILIMQLELFVVAILLLQISVFNATGLRLLRTLPGSALALTTYLFLLPLALVAASICFFSLVLLPWLMGAAPAVDVVALSGALFVSALALPAALALRQAAMSLIVIFLVALAGLIPLAWAYVQRPWHDTRLLAGLALLAACLGFYRMHAQLSRGSRVYRLQPFMTARWRGNDEDD